MINALTWCSARIFRKSMKSRLGVSSMPFILFHSCRRSAINATRSSGVKRDQYSRSASASSANDAQRRSQTAIARFYALLPPPEVHAAFFVIGGEVFVQVGVDEWGAVAVGNAVDGGRVDRFGG